MMSRFACSPWLASLLAVGAVGACGKSGKEEPAAAAPANNSTGSGAASAAKAVDATPSAATTPPAAGNPGANAAAVKHGDDHVVYSLVDNRLSAHLSRHGGLLVNGGSAGFAKYVRFNNLMRGANKKSWDLRQTDGDVRVARIAGKTATVFVPLTASQAGGRTLRMRVHADSSGTLSVRINDGKEINSKLASGWQTVELPSSDLGAGENSIALFAKPGLELAWMQVGGDVPVDDSGDTAFYDAASKSLAIPKAGAMSWYVAVPDKTKLVAHATNCAVDALVTADDGTTQTGRIDGDASIDLAAMAGKAVRIDLASGCDAKLSDAALVQAGAEPAVKRGEPPKNVVFVIMDSLRADRVRPFNPKARPETPNWDKLAESSAVFANDYVQGNESQVSHASIWSSNYLAKHRAAEMEDKLADKWMTIDEVGKKANKLTIGVSGNGYIRPSRGFGPSWDKFSNHIEKDLGLRGADIVDHGMSWVQPKKDQPWFLYLGLIDTHVTWRAKQPWMSKYDGDYHGRFQTEYGDDGPGGSDGKDLTEREHEHVRALYDSNVSYQDDLMGKLVDKLKSWGVWDQTMLVITADHGDEQWEDGRVGHGGSERDTLLHVPLLIHYPPMFPTAHVTQGTESIDIEPTIADALGVAQDPEWQGTSLLPVANGQGGYPMMSFSSQYEDWHAGRIGHWKLKLHGTQSPRLYDMTKDPDERDDIFGKAASDIGARLLLDPMWILRQWNVEWKKAQWGNASDVSSRFAADLGE
jgi:arylsulfatase A-like enzyme|nr:sulfatase-like hydrolase/transferase [Kofleriaceae bacterium]